jgi:hypothetical protein
VRLEGLGQLGGLILILSGWFLGYVSVFVRYYRNCIGFLVLFTDFPDGA